MPSFSEVFALYDQPFQVLTRTAATVHLRRWDAARRPGKASIQAADDACGRDCSCCTRAALHPARTVPVWGEIRPCVEAALDCGQRRFHLPTTEALRMDLPSLVALVRRVHAEGLDVCSDPELADPVEARWLKEAGCSILCHRLKAERGVGGLPFVPVISGARIRSLRIAQQAGLRVCVNCPLGPDIRPSDALRLLQILADEELRPEFIRFQLPESAPDGSGETLHSDVIRLIATARILMPHSRISLSLPQSQDHRSLMLAHLCGANSIWRRPRRGSATRVGGHLDALAAGPPR